MIVQGFIVSTYLYNFVSGFAKDKTTVRSFLRLQPLEAVKERN